MIKNLKFPKRKKSKKLNRGLHNKITHPATIDERLERAKVDVQHKILQKGHH